MRSQPSSWLLMSAVIWQYECVHVIPRPPMFAPGLMNSFRASRFRSTKNRKSRLPGILHHAFAGVARGDAGELALEGCGG